MLYLIVIMPVKKQTKVHHSEVKRRMDGAHAMTTNSRLSGILRRPGLAAFLCVVAAGAGGCAQSVSSSEPSAARKILGSETAAPATSGFLKDCTQPTSGGQGKPSLVYIDSNAAWGNYGKILVDPVQFAAAPGSSVSSDDQQALYSYFYNKLRGDLQKHFTLAENAGQA